jgi:chromosome segregation and condensation protein ScpB
VRQLFPAHKLALDLPALGTLSIIAPRQRLRADIKAVRGVNIDGVLTLMGAVW